MEAQRFWVERALEDAKGQAGLAEYQVRGWQAWHHHIALVMMTMLFMSKQKMVHDDEHPLLSCYDIKILLAHFLPKKNCSVEEILRQLEARHVKRQSAIDSATKRQKSKNKKFEAPIIIKSCCTKGQSAKKKRKRPKKIKTKHENLTPSELENRKESNSALTGVLKVMFMTCLNGLLNILNIV